MDESQPTYAPRVALLMAGLAGLFWYASFPHFYADDDFPNCVSARWGGELFAVGSVSHRGRSSVFFEIRDFEKGITDWSERRDGHFCGFAVPPFEYLVEPKGFNVHLGPNAVSWTCPYWLMVAVWLTACFQTRRQWQFTIRDALAGMTVVALALAAIQLRVALLATTFLNLATAWLILRVIIKALRTFASARPTAA